MDVPYTFKIKKESQSLNEWCIKDQWPHPNQDQDTKSQSKASSIMQYPNQDLKDVDVFRTPNIKIESQYLNHECVKDQLPYPNQDQDSNAKSGASSVLKSQILELTGVFVREL